jgi:hypothetical protein
MWLPGKWGGRVTGCPSAHFILFGRTGFSRSLTESPEDVINAERTMNVKFSRTLAIAGAAAAALLVVSACSSSSSTHDEQSFNLNGNNLVIDAQSSELKLVPGSGSSVDVQRWLSGTAAKSGNASWSLSGDTLALTINCSGVVFSCGAQFQVAVPPNVSVDVRAGSNNVTVSNLKNSLEINGGSGSVSVSDTTGPLQISTGSGAVIATGVHSSTVRATTNQGSVSITFASAPQNVNVTSGSGNATVKVPTSGNAYHVVTSSGSGSRNLKVANDPRSSNVVRVTTNQGAVSILPA